MAGYYGYSMSNNAIAAYSSGEKPMSKWTKSEILHELKKQIREDEIEVDFSMELLEKAPAAAIKEMCLSYSSWHHTSKHFNKTDFYEIDLGKVVELTDEEIVKITEEQKAIKSEQKPKEEKWKCAFLEWSGTRAHPKATEITEVGIVKGNWFYRENGQKKKTTANGFRFLEKLDGSKPQSYTEQFSTQKSEKNAADNKPLTFNSKYYVVKTYKDRGDEFVDLITDDIRKAINRAQNAHLIEEREKSGATIEIRKYSEDIEKEDCKCFDYNTIDFTKQGFVTRKWKVYGAEGHRQKMSFNSSIKYDFTTNNDIRLIEIENEDITGTNEYSIISVTKRMYEDCKTECWAQLGDGAFANCRTGKIVELEKECRTDYMKNANHSKETPTFELKPLKENDVLNKLNENALNKDIAKEVEKSL